MSEVTDLTSYYQNLLIKQYYDKPNAVATVGAIIKEALADMVYKQVRDSFNIETAIGPQLDLLGAYVGALRHPDASTALEDSEFRFFIKMKTIKNSTNNSMKSIDDYMFKFFGDSVKVVNNQDMTISYEFSIFFQDIMAFAKQTDALPRPLSVGILLEALLNPNGDFGFSYNNGDNNGGVPIFDPQISGFGFTPNDAPIVDEAQNSINTTIVLPTETVMAVSGVWLASDPGHVGTNYYTGGSFNESSITLGVPLPGPITAVLINYTAHYGGSLLYING